ncbi:PTS transporter subunit EIIC [Alkaliphilus sp. B6464]|uniref:PTS transporter subunit EIIC n=1 Tax=Alkaliphilus sp. B6464 TaxID=2731219 RepID=UPI001BACEC26|nr:PTS transporter subunit EIIC [Alkaliphilus sp. B6464]QUH18827.1 PTS transporter subunit EIIC [Alkaliphilus sp. B6464]
MSSKAPNKIDILSRSIINEVGGGSNIKTAVNCMTRLRMTLKDESKVNLDALKAVEGVMGVVKSDGQLQVIVGPGTATKVAEEVRKIAGVSENIKFGEADKVKSEMKSKYGSSLSGPLKKISNIFIPLIPAFIGSGLIMGINNLITKWEWVQPGTLTALLGIFGNAVFAYMAIMVGMNAAKEFGGSPALGGVMAGILLAPGLADVELFGKALVPGRGGIIAVLLVVAFSSFIEKKLRKSIPESLELIFTPLLTILISGFVAMIVLQPLGGMISDGIGNVVTSAIETGGPVVGALLAGTFLPLVMTGLHQGLTPIHADLITKLGVNTLLPILAMAGAGQVGAAFAVYVKTKNERLKRTVKSALPVGILGIREPLIYGVTLPLGRPFLGACIGAAFGGAFNAMFKVGSISMGLSGLPLATLITPNKIVFYLLGVVIAYVAGFIATSLLGFEDPVE